MKKLGPLLFTRGPHFCSLKCGSLFLSLQIPSFAHSEFWTSLKSYPWYWVFDIIFVAKCCFVQGSCAGAVPATRSRSKKDSQYFSVSQAKPRPGTITFILSLVGPFWGKRPFLIKPHWCSACYHGTLGQPTLPGEQGSQAKPGVRHYCVHRSLQQTPPHPQADPYRYLFGKPYGFQYVVYAKLYWYMQSVQPEQWRSLVEAQKPPEKMRSCEEYIWKTTVQLTNLFSGSI